MDYALRDKSIEVRRTFMNRNIFLPGCFLLLVVSLASPLFPSDSVRSAEKNFVMYIEEEFGYSPNAIRTTEGSYVSITQGDTVRKISESGQILWQQKLLFQISNEQYLLLDGIAETDHGYILVGGTYDWDDIPVSGVIVKLRTDGSVQWSKTFESQDNDHFDSVSLTADGGYIVVGHSWTLRGTALVKFTANGDIIWSKIFDALPFLYNIVPHPVSDGIILASSSRILKVNDSGSVVWKKSLQINGFQLHAMGPSSDNGVILAGKSSRRVMLVRVSSDGKVDWKAAYLLKDPWFSISNVTRTSDDGYVISGTKFNGPNYENAEGLVVKIDSKQKLVLRKKFGFSDSEEYAGKIFPIADGGYVIFGLSRAYRGYAILFLNVNSEGIVPGCRFFDHLSVQKVSSPVVRTQSLELTSRKFALTAGIIEASSAASISPASTVCP
jgi:hypothetical protein